MSWKITKVKASRLILTLIIFIALILPRYLHICVPDFGARCDHSFFERILYYIFWPYMLIGLIVLQSLFIVEHLILGPRSEALYKATLFISDIITQIILFLIAYFFARLVISSYNKFRKLRF